MCPSVAETLFSEVGPAYILPWEALDVRDWLIVQKTADALRTIMDGGKKALVVIRFLWFDAKANWLEKRLNIARLDRIAAM